MFKIAFIGLFDLKERRDKFDEEILVGDSGVGKTSLIQRFCRDHFKEAFAATVGVDLQVKMIKIENQIIGLQIWDTVRTSTIFDLLFDRRNSSLGWSRTVGDCEKIFQKKIFLRLDFEVLQDNIFENLMELFLFTMSHLKSHFTMFENGSPMFVYVIRFLQ